MDIELLKTLCNSGKTLAFMASEFGTTKALVSNKLRELGMQPKTGRPKSDKVEAGIPHCACGEKDPTKYYNNIWDMCGKCNLEYTKKRWKINRLFAHDYFGGRCLCCGFNRNVSSFCCHHLAPHKKDVRAKNMYFWKRERLIDELDICIYLCSNCHLAYHANELDADGMKIIARVTLEKGFPIADCLKPYLPEVVQ